MQELLTVSEVGELLKLSRSRVYAHVAAGRIPKPIHIAPRTPRWRREEIESWIERLAAREARAA